MTNKQLEIADTISEDAWFGCTPDLPQLRYNGEIKVFIWDELQHLNHMQRILINCNTRRDFTTTNYMCFTEKTYLPVQNVNEQSTDKNKYFLPEVSGGDYRALLPPKVAELIPGQPRSVSGRIFSCSLDGLRAFDRHYVNGHLFQRSKQKIITNIKTNGSNEVDAWVYTIKMGRLCRYDPHDGVYNFSTNFHPRGMTAQHQSGRPVWKKEYHNNG
jgi:hypothetical protein